jgi:serine/threonine protein kinase
MAHGRYTIIGKLADGGMAEIFLARQHGVEGFEKLVVLKRILTAFSADPQFRNMFLDEAHIVMSLAHGNIVQVLDLGVSGGRTFLVMELVDGWDLERILTRAQATGPDHPWPPSLALYVTAQVCRALAYAHGKRGADGRPLGIVHRDISPSNVLVSEQGEVKLADFGIAKAQNKREQTAAGIIKGKVGFMSPEQAHGKPLDARSDLFSVGTLLYLMLTGRKPFDAGSELESMLRAQKADFQPPEELNPYLPTEATAIVNRVMRREPGARYPSADELLHDVEQVLRAHYHSAGQTELVAWLADLARRDKDLPMGRARPWEPSGVGGAAFSASGAAGAGTGAATARGGGGDLVGTSLELSDADVPGDAPTAVGALSPDGLARLPTPPPLLTPRSDLMPDLMPALTPALTPAPTPPPLVATGSAGTAGVVHPVPDPVKTSATRRRKSRIGLGFVMGAFCMLGAVYAIRSLARWAGHEQPGISRWFGVGSGDDAAVPATASATPESSPGAAAPEGDAQAATARPASPSSAEAAAAGGGPGIETPAGAAGGAAGASAVAAAAGSPVAPAAVSSGAGGTAGAGAPDDAAGDPDDEERLLKRVAPGGVPVIGEDETDEADEAPAPGAVAPLPPPREPQPTRVAVEPPGAPEQAAAKTDTKTDAKTEAKTDTKTGRAVEPAARAPAAAASAPRPSPSPSTSPFPLPSAPRAAAAAPRAQPITLRITSSPRGAVVRTKKHVLGRTPLSARFNPGGTYQLTFVKKGYVTTSRRVAVAPSSKSRSLAVSLKRAHTSLRSRLFRGR